MKRKLTCTNYIIILEKTFSREHTKNPNTNVRACPDFTFWAVDYHSPPKSQPAIHIYYDKISEHTYLQKDKLELRGGGDVLKIVFLFSIC